MSQLRSFGSIVMGRLSSRRICGQTLGSATPRFTMGEESFRRGVAVTVVSAGLLGGLWYFKDAQKPAASKLSVEKVVEEETMEAAFVTDEKEELLKRRFEAWMIKYGCTYKDEEEKKMRYRIFRYHSLVADEENMKWGNGTIVSAPNCFVDRREEEHPCHKCCSST